MHSCSWLVSISFNLSVCWLFLFLSSASLFSDDARSFVSLSISSSLALSCVLSAKVESFEEDFNVFNSFCSSTTKSWSLIWSHFSARYCFSLASYLEVQASSLCFNASFILASWQFVNSRSFSSLSSIFFSVASICAWYLVCRRSNSLLYSSFSSWISTYIQKGTRLWKPEWLITQP